MTIFLRILEPSASDKSDALLEAIRDVFSSNPLGPQVAVFERSPHMFCAVPGSPFAYWVDSSVTSIFGSFPKFGEGVIGASTKNDFRYLRATWEVAASAIVSKRNDTFQHSWVLFAKGGAYSAFHADIYLAINWKNDGQELKADISEYRGTRGWGYQWSAALNGHGSYFRPGLTWPLRTDRLSFRVLPAGCLFGHKGPSAFSDDDRPLKLLATCAIINSSVFRYLVTLQLARTELAQSYEVGIIQQTPVPRLTEDDTATLAGLARRAWSLKRGLDTTNETSHAFLLPPGVNEKLTGLDCATVHRELTAIQREIDEHVFRLYGIGAEDRVTIEAAATGLAAAPPAMNEGNAETESNEDDAEDEDASSAPSDTLFSWFVGIAFGRFDLRLATGERVIPPEPEPFAPLPPRSPGMWPDGETRFELPPDIMADDPGHNNDIRERVAESMAKTGWPDPHDLRQWLAHEFFPLHIKMYSKSRRKAPIYWQLATPSASYSVWLYIHAFTKDTLFRVQKDYAELKLAHEERRFETMTRELRDKTTAADRKTLAAQETFVEELRAFVDEVKRVAPLWKPNLDDGVIINFAPLWRLVPHYKSWQKELKAIWDALCDGKYDWAHLAMHLWPERVVPKCATDRSLAIAHGIEEVFWIEGVDGKWTQRSTPTQPIQELVRERTSPAVKAALESLLGAPVAAGRPKKSRKANANA